MVYLNTESHFESFYSMYTVYSQHLFHYGGAPGSPLPPAALRGACRRLLPILGRPRRLRRASRKRGTR